MQDVIDRLTEEKDDLSNKCEEEVKKRMKVEEDNMAPKVKLDREVEGKTKLQKEKASIEEKLEEERFEKQRLQGEQASLQSNLQQIVQQLHELEGRNRELKDENERKSKLIEDLKRNVDVCRIEVEVDKDNLEKRLKIIVEKVLQLDQMLEQDLLGKKKLKKDLRSLESNLNDAKSKFERIAVAKDVLEKQYEMDKQEMVRRIKDGQHTVSS